MIQYIYGGSSGCNKWLMLTGHSRRLVLVITGVQRSASGIPLVQGISILATPETWRLSPCWVLLRSPADWSRCPQRVWGKTACSPGSRVSKSFVDDYLGAMYYSRAPVALPSDDCFRLLGRHLACRFHLLEFFLFFPPLLQQYAFVEPSVLVENQAFARLRKTHP